MPTISTAALSRVARAEVCSHTLAAVLRGDRTVDVRTEDWPHLLQAAEDQGVAPLLAWTLRANREPGSLPDTVGAHLQDALINAAASEQLARRALSQALDALASARIPCVVFKGAGLAHLVYPDACLRRVSDADLLVRPSDRDRAIDVLVSLGYAPQQVLTGSVVSYQVPLTKAAAPTIDLHWQVSNRPVLAGLVDWDMLAGGAIPVPQLGSDARTPCISHALLLACLHRVAHHRERDYLLWLYDIHLLLNAAATRDLDDFVHLAREKEVQAICSDGIRAAATAWNTNGAFDLTRRLATSEREATAMLLTPAAWRGDIRLFDLRSAPGVRTKMALVREVVLPDVGFMRSAYPAHPHVPVPFLYAHRVLRGTWRLLQRWARAA